MTIAFGPRLLRSDRDAFFQSCRIVGANLGADAVLQRRDDLAACGVVLGIGSENQRDIEPKRTG